MKSIFFGLTRQYFLALSTVAAPLWLAVVLLLVGGPWLGQVLMVAASGGEVDPDALPTDKLRLLCHLMATVFSEWAPSWACFKPRPTCFACRSVPACW